MPRPLASSTGSDGGGPPITASLDTAVPRVARHGIEATPSTRQSARLAEAIKTLPTIRSKFAYCRLASRNDAILRRRLPERTETVYRHAVTKGIAGRPGSRRNNRNGSGKSTLLRLFAAVYPDLAAADNIHLLCGSVDETDACSVDETVNG